MPKFIFLITVVNLFTHSANISQCSSTGDAGMGKKRIDTFLMQFTFYWGDRKCTTKHIILCAWRKWKQSKGIKSNGEGLAAITESGKPSVRRWRWSRDYPMQLHFHPDTHKLVIPGNVLRTYIYILRLVSFNQDGSGKLHFIWKTKLAFSHRNMLDIFRNMLVGLSSELSRGRVTSLNTAPHFTWQVIIIIANRYWALIMSCVRHESMCFTCIISFSADNHSEADYLSQL